MGKLVVPSAGQSVSQSDGFSVSCSVVQLVSFLFGQLVG